MDREGNVQSKHGQVFAVESVLIGCHLSSARTESKNWHSPLGPKQVFSQQDLIFFFLFFLHFNLNICKICIFLSYWNHQSVYTLCTEAYLLLNSKAH